MKSPQEVLLQQIGETSLGRQFVFEPANYRKGSGSREPADLVWACNNCIVLMYMALRKHKRRKPDAHAFIRKELIKHNLKQAKGWLSEWRNNGQLLTGHNATRQFSIAPADYQHVVVLSVLDCGDNLGEYHQDYADALNVTLCATVPHTALIEIARIGGGLIEVLILIGSLRGLAYLGIPPVCDALWVVRENHTQALQYADPERKWISYSPNEATETIRQILNWLRGPNSAFVEAGSLFGDRWEIGSILNDLPLKEIYALTVIFRDLIHLAGPDSKYTGNATLVAQGYYVGLSATTFTSANSAELNEPMVNVARQSRTDDNSKGLLLLVWDTYFNQLILMGSALKSGLRITDELIAKIVSFTDPETFADFKKIINAP